MEKCLNGCYVMLRFWIIHNDPAKLHMKVSILTYFTPNYRDIHSSCMKWLRGWTGNSENELLIKGGVAIEGREGTKSRISWWNELIS